MALFQLLLLSLLLTLMTQHPSAWLKGRYWACLLKVRESAESQKEEEESKVSPQEGEKGYKQQWNLHSDFKGGETTEASSIWNKQAMVGISTAKGGKTTEAHSIASKQVTVRVSIAKGGETTQYEARNRHSTAKGGPRETTEESSIARKQATVGVWGDKCSSEHL